MEQQQDSSLFGLSLDQTGRSHLAEVAKWAKFLSIVGFISCGLIVLAAFFSASVFSAFSSYDDSYETRAMTSGMGVFMAIMLIGGALIYFFPILFLYRFATKMKTALASNDNDTLNASFQNLKASIRFIGILTIITLAIYALGFLMSILAA